MQKLSYILIHRRILHRFIIIKTSTKSTSVEISMGPHPVRIFTIYKLPRKILTLPDLYLLTNGCEWFAVTGDINAKHTFWNSRCVQLYLPFSIMLQTTITLFLHQRPLPSFHLFLVITLMYLM